MPNSVQIVTDQKSDALVYVLDFVFKHYYGCGYTLISNPDEIQPGGVRINYSAHRLENAIQITPSGYLFESDLSKYPLVELQDWQGIPIFFATDGDIPFDWFGALFFLLARAEEYRNEQRDEHGRFRAEYSVLPLDFIERPIIDEWLVAFRDSFLLDSGLTFTPRKFQWINTFDIDVAYAFKYRSVGRKIAAAAKNILRGDIRSFTKRFKVLIWGEMDPFDTYEFQAEVSNTYHIQTIYFFLLGNKNKYDRNLSWKRAGMRTLIDTVSKYASVGIHPSYASVDLPNLLDIEVERLATILGTKIEKSRQHFLRFKLADTYRNLIQNGILEDYSMGYADSPGFRSGTATPHYFFDLERRQATRLKLFPLAVMDGTLRDYQSLNSSIASQTLKDLIDRVKAVNGTFVSLWHNDTLQDVPANFWRQLYLEMASYASRS